MMNALGIETGWRLVQGTPEFFSCTKKLHNTLHGDPVDLTDQEKAIYEQVTFENAMRLHPEMTQCSLVGSRTRRHHSKPDTRLDPTRLPLTEMAT
jgi:hypothetical protein